MDDQLYRLIYISRNEIAGDEIAVRSEIEQLLTKARQRNAKLNVTGALLFNSGCFAQILEGRHDDIQEIFERIQCDTRHSHVVVLAFEIQHQRVFRNWSMAYISTNAEAMIRFGDIQQSSGFDMEKLDSERIFELLRQNLYDLE